MLRRNILLALIPLLATAAFAQDSLTTSANGGVVSGSAHFSAPPPGQVVAGAPYSAEETNTKVQTLADGTHITHAGPIRKLYRDSAGRTRTEGPVTVEITDPVAHVKYTLDTVRKVAHRQTIGAPRAQMATRHAPAPGTTIACPVLNDCARGGPRVTVEKLARQTFEGLLVAGERRTTVIPAGFEGNDRPVTVVSENWVSPELRVTVPSADNDPRHGESTRKLINVDRSEPDPSLFLPPADYTAVEEKGDFTIKWGTEGR